MNKNIYKTLFLIFFPAFMYFFQNSHKDLCNVFGEVITMKCVAIIYASNEF